MRSVLQKSLYIFICLSLMIVLVGVTPAYAASISVTTTADDDNFAPSCSLREAIVAANTDAAYGGCPAGSGSDTITLLAGTFTLSAELPPVTSTIIINGNGAATTIIQANANPNTSGYRIISVNSGGNLTLNNLTARNGYTPSNGGGGVLNSGTLTITNSSILNNSSPSNSGGGVFNDFSATMTVTNSTFSGNSANIGGGVYNNGTLTVTNSTFATNSAAGGGGIFNSILLTITNSTLSGNSAAASGGGILTAGTFNYANTIIANSTSGGDCVVSAGTIGTNTNNLVENGGCSAALSGDPNLGPLADNGGPTQTMALLSPSSALNAGNTTICASAPVNNLDQRGISRPQGTQCDIGAYEVASTQSGPAFVVNSNADTSDGLCDLRGQGFGNQDCTLREAIDTSNAQAGANTITFDSAYVNAANPITTNGSSALSSITTQITITGNSATDTIIQAGLSAGSANRRIFLVTSTGNLTLNKLTLKNGHCYLSCVGFPGGGAILSQGILTINDSIFSDNHANNYEGGSILNIGTLTVNNSTFLGNPAYASDSGGAISNGSSFSGLSGTATISNSTFSGNYTGNSGAAIANVTAGSTLTLVNSSIFDNHSTGNRAGAIFVRGTVNIYNSTISGNVANINGDNIYQDAGTLNLYNTIIANSTSHGDCVTNSGTVSSTNSLIESTGANACGLINNTNGNIIGSDPNLGTLTGSPAYLPLNTGSLAINAGSNAICAATPVNNQSQNGVTRPAGIACDIGSVEMVATIAITIGGVNRGTYNLAQGSSQRVNYAGLDAGPVVVDATNDIPIISALRDAYFVGGNVESFVQLMGLPEAALSTKYYFPAYNNVTLDGQLRFGNVGNASTTVTVTIAGVVRGTYNLAPGQAQRVNYAGLDAGPVIVESSGGVPIIAALRDAYFVNGQIESFAQLMGLPVSQLSDTYYFPAYNNVTLNGQLRIGNVDTVSTTVTVTIAGVVRGTYPLAPNEAVRINYAGLDAGPVVVQSSGNVKVIAALRDAYFVNGQVASFVQLMGLPLGQLSTKYYFPAYNNVTLDGQLRFGNVGNSNTTVTVTIAGVVRGTYNLTPGQAQRVNYTALDAGPVVVESSGGVPIIAALRDAYFVNGQIESFAQLMGLPDAALSPTYYFPAYNNVTLDGQLRFGVP